MNRPFRKFLSALKANVWVVLAFFVPLIIRSIPEALSWPYPIGVDTIHYIPTIESGNVLLLGPLVFIKSQLFYSIATLLYWLIGNGVVVIDILGPVLMGFVAVLMFLYARRGLGWNCHKSFLVSLLVAIYFVSLRDSWDLYAQSVGLIFLFATLLVLKSSNSPKRYVLALVFMILTVLSHQLISVILFFALGLEAILNLAMKRSPKDFVFSFTSLGLAFALFLFRLYSPQTGSFVIPVANVASSPSINLAETMIGVLVYCFLLLLPFAVVGFVRLKSWVLQFWAVWCLAAVIALMFFPTLPLYYWNRWVYLLVYPLLFFTCEGLDRLWRFWSSHTSKIRRLAPKVVALGYVVLLLALSGFYLTANPDNQIAFFSNNNYLSVLPSSMLQNILPISDNPSLVKCLDWINNNASKDSVVVLHYALYALVRVYGVDEPVIVVNQNPSWVNLQNENNLAEGMVDASRQALSAGNSTVYTVWWISGDGWFNIPSLPSNFKEVFQADRMAVYKFDPVV